MQSTERSRDCRALAEVVLAKALGRCIQTIQSQLTEGQTDELLDHAALDNCAHDNIQSAHTHHARIALLIASELEQRRQLLLALGDWAISRRASTAFV